MTDIAPELLEKIQKEFREKYDKDTAIAELFKKFEAGTATHAEAYAYADRVGSILAESYRDNLSSAILPDGKMWYNIADRVITPTMQQNYNFITKYVNDVQSKLNEAAGIGIKPITATMNEDRIKGIVNRLSSEDNYDDVAWILQEPVKTAARSVVDDSIKVNSEFHGKSGMRPKIIRKSSGNCCEWCNAIAGVYYYPDVPKDVYRRHENCDCVVEYDPGNGKIQNVHSKHWHNETERDRPENLKVVTAVQNYLPVKGSEILSMTDRKMGELQLLKIDGYDKVYVQSGVGIKPKALHNINQNVLAAINAYGGNAELKPKLVVIDRNKLGSALGKYDCVQNVIYVVPDIGDKKLLTAFTSLDRNIKFGSTEYHECWHWMQAQRYGNAITYETRDTQYMPWLIKNCQENIETLGITEYNVLQISEYAARSFQQGRFDEVEAEYYLMKALKQRK